MQTDGRYNIKFSNDVRTKQSDMNERVMKVESTVENMSKSLNETETCECNKEINRAD